MIKSIYEHQAALSSAGTIHRLSDMALSVLWLRKSLQSGPNRLEIALQGQVLSTLVHVWPYTSQPVPTAELG